ncbi:ComF family protein [Natronocella acetinitrilica]|uniref:ComF family protein n=1 Tax=Natronocella acetinitrilica TaxID=414046 RepID=A0AAE3G3P9_9GAMM|nr:ComF family protein [Natronocella acetinitrilica]MCP1675220.1 ComF family protein [Natronocella acetinitrilica]
MLIEKVYNALERSLDTCFPPRCRLCGDPGVGADICPACYHDLPWNLQACPICAEPASAPCTPCGRCQKEHAPYDLIRAPWVYGPPLDHLIQALKFHGDLAAGRLLGQLLTWAVQNAATDIDCLIPMPLHRSRLQERGYNQAMELARPLARQTGLQPAPGVVHRCRATAAQSALPREARKANMRQAFNVTGMVAGRRIAVIDDVVTSTATARAIAGALLEAGAARIEIWAVCRTPRETD